MNKKAPKREKDISGNLLPAPQKSLYLTQCSFNQAPKKNPS